MHQMEINAVVSASRQIRSAEKQSEGWYYLE